MKWLFPAVFIAGLALVPFFQSEIETYIDTLGLSTLFGKNVKYRQMDSNAKDGCASWTLGPDHGNPENVEGELVLITGGSGFIGSSTVELMLELGYKIRIFDNLETGNIMYVPLDHPNVEFVYGDISDMSALESAMDGVTGTSQQHTKKWIGLFHALLLVLQWFRVEQPFQEPFQIFQTSINNDSKINMIDSVFV